MIAASCVAFSPLAFAEHDHHMMPDMMPGISSDPMGPADCEEMEVWDVGMGMCMPLPMDGMPMRMLMVHGNAFGVYVNPSGPRGRKAVAGPDMLMADIGTSLGARQYLNLDYMATFEKWTFPDRGYPLLMQIGEDQPNGQPFLDAQHPHNSPVMGLTLSDTVKLGKEKDCLKVYFAPRGESTDGPIAFMHRPTGMVNPDAPLGHHIGQDVGHITSTVIGESLKLGDNHFEISTFHGAEPEPEKVDLPLGTPDSVSLRYIHDFTPSVTAMASYAYVNSPEPHAPEIGFERRYSASVYTQSQILGDWLFHNAFIYGAVTNYDHASILNSFGEEFWFHKGAPNVWGRIEWLQRTPAELQISTPSDPNAGEWVAALTLGYTHTVLSFEGAQLGVGGSATKDFLPRDFMVAYGGNPWTGKIFIQLGGMNMWGL